jgi:hypothetical protein
MRTMIPLDQSGVKGHTLIISRLEVIGRDGQSSCCTYSSHSKRDIFSR